MSCPNCFSGHTHNGSPLGEVIKLHGLDVYVTKPSGNVATKGIIIVIPDAFGWEFVNNRLLADHYAEKGKYLVYLPEFMQGCSAPLWLMSTMKELLKTGSAMDWIKKPYFISCAIIGMVPFMYYNRFGSSWPIVKSFFTAVRENEGTNIPTGAAGFCWGGKHVVNLARGTDTAADGKPLIDAGFTGHPSMLELPREIERMKIPVSFALGEKDMSLKMPQIEQIRNIVENKPDAEKGEVKIYFGAGHGFCVRADHVLEDATKQATEAEEQALDWFNKHFSSISP